MIIVETRAYRDINIIICIKKLKNFEGGSGQDDVISCSERGGLSNSDGGEGGGKNWRFLHDVICERPLIGENVVVTTKLY